MQIWSEMHHLLPADLWFQSFSNTVSVTVSVSADVKRRLMSVSRVPTLEQQRQQQADPLVEGHSDKPVRSHRRWYK